MYFLPATADTGHRTQHYTVLLNYLKLPQTAAKDGPSHGTDFLIRSQSALWLEKLRESSQLQTRASFAVLSRNLSPRDAHDRRWSSADLQG